MAVPNTQSLTLLPAERIARLEGFGMASAGDSYVYRPTTVDEIREVFTLARSTGRQVVLRGAGRSYGDASVGRECLGLDISRMKRVLSWNRETGVAECEGGVTIEALWRHTLEDGWWPAVVSGTMFPTLAGALAMNIHGKNNFRVGTLGEHVLEMDVLTTNGDLLTLTPASPDTQHTTPNASPALEDVISSAGLLGVITRVKLQMKRVTSGDLRVLPVSIPNWDAQFSTFEEMQGEADYMVSWIDCFASGAKAGRGQFHAAWYQHEENGFHASLRPENQDLPDTILGFIPKSRVWRVLKTFNNPVGMRVLNWSKYLGGKLLGNGRMHEQSLVGFSFLLDYIPHWRKAYLPYGFIQYQCFVPKDRARSVFDQIVKMQHDEGLVSFLGVMKRHRPDSFLFSHGVDGYSLALDFKITRRNWPRLRKLCHSMNDVVHDAGGRFYFAKDSTLRPEDVARYLGPGALARFRDLRHELDPDSLLTSELARRLGLSQ